MKKLIVIAIVLMISNYMQATIKIACIGDNATLASHLTKSNKYSYPAQLQEILGKTYQVKNFAKKNATVINKLKSQQFKDVQDYNPDIIFMELGLSDIKFNLIMDYQEFEQALYDLVYYFQCFQSKPRIVLLIPPPIYEDSTITGISNSIVRTKLNPAIRNVAFKTRVEVVDLNYIIDNTAYIIPDKINLSSLGYSVIARRCYETVTLDEETLFSLIQNLKFEIEPINYYGYASYDFNYKGFTTKIVIPKKVLSGHQWVICPKSSSRSQLTELALLERGFHVVYFDMHNDTEILSVFYEIMQMNGLNSKICLIANKNNALTMLNWAKTNPDMISSILLINPNFDSNNFKIEEYLQVLSESRVPILIVSEDGLNIVFLNEIKLKFLEQNADFSLFEKEKNASNWNNPDFLVNFVLEKARKKTNFAIIPIYGTEYRTASIGWTANSDWFTEFEDINQGLQKPIDILFLGNSITQGIGSGRTKVERTIGKLAFEKAFKEKKLLSAGIASDKVQHVLWRIQNATYGTIAPKNIVLTIGVNNFNEESTIEIVDGIEKCVNLLCEKFPSSNIILLGPLPAGRNHDHMLRLKYNMVHCRLQSIIFPPIVKYCNTDKLFINKDGVIPQEISADEVHLTEKGYEMWADFIKKIIE